MVVEQVDEATYLIEARIPRARFVFSVYLLAREEAVLIEPGPSVAVPSILEGMRQLGLDELAVIMPTHIHMDHGGGAGMLAKEFPRAKVVVHPKAAKHALDPSRLIDSTRIAYSDDFEKTYGPILPIKESQLTIAEDGDVIRAGGRGLRMIHSPGHAFHHMSIFDEKTHNLFCGEALGVSTAGAESIVMPAVSVGDLDVDAYLESIEKLRELQPRMLFYPHEGGARTPGDIFDRIRENTVMLRDLILEARKEGRSTEEIEERIRDRLSHPSQEGMGPAGMEGIILGYDAYFKRKDLI